MSKERTIGVYDARAGEFVAKFKDFLDSHERDELDEFIALLPGKRILDAGCGGGDHAVYFQERGLDVVAIDLSAEMVRIATGKGVDARIMDLEDMRFDHQFDGIWSVTSLLHLPKAHCPAVAQRMHDLLVPGGILYVCVKRGDDERVEDDGRFFAYWQPEELKRLFDQFSYLKGREIQVGKNTFIQLFFRKD